MRFRTPLHQLIITTTFLLTSSLAARAAEWDDTESADSFRRGDLTSVKRILNEEEFSGETLVAALESSLLSGNVDLVRYLASRGWFEKCEDKKGCDAVYNAAASGSAELVQFLMSKGFRPDPLALSTAAKKGFLEIVDILCLEGADPDEEIQYDSRKAPVLEEAKKVAAGTQIYFGDLLQNARLRAGVARSIDFIESGQCKAAAKQPIRVGKKWNTELAALRRGDVVAVKSFIAQRGTYKNRPVVQVYEFYEAVLSGNVELLQYLGGLGWIQQCRALDYCRPIHIAASQGASNKIVEYLISERFDINEYDDQRQQTTPLEYAAIFGHAENVKFLCQRGARSNTAHRPLLNQVQDSYDLALCALDLGLYSSCLGEEGPGKVEVSCTPGIPCGGHAFPPAGPNQVVQRIVALNEVFQYLKSGRCSKSNTSGEQEAR